MATNKTYAQRRKKWLNALESGEYRQTRYQLHTPEGFCCLGVACDRFNKPLKLKVLKSPTRTEYNHQSALLPVPVADYLGLHSTSGAFQKDGRRVNLSIKVRRGAEKGQVIMVSSLTELNDEASYSFKEIAKFVRKNRDIVFQQDK